MSLIKQLWLVIILVMSLVFAASFVINTTSARHYLVHQLEAKNTDNAVSLALYKKLGFVRTGEYFPVFACPIGG